MTPQPENGGANPISGTKKCAISIAQVLGDSINSKEIKFHEAPIILGSIVASLSNESGIPIPELISMVQRAADCRAATGKRLRTSRGAEGEEVKAKRVKYLRKSLCSCGYGVLKDSVPLGAEYYIDPKVTSAGQMQCGGCGKTLEVALVKVVSPAPAGWIPRGIFGEEAG